MFIRCTTTPTMAPTMAAIVHPTNRGSMMTTGMTVHNECVWRQRVRRQCTIGHAEWWHPMLIILVFNKPLSGCHSLHFLCFPKNRPLKMFQSLSLKQFKNYQKFYSAWCKPVSLAVLLKIHAKLFQHSLKCYLGAHGTQPWVSRECRWCQKNIQKAATVE